MALNINDLMNTNTNIAKTLQEVGPEMFLEVEISRVTTATMKSGYDAIFFEGNATEVVTGETMRISFFQNVLKDESRRNNDIKRTMEYLAPMFRQCGAQNFGDVLNKKICIKTYLGKDGEHVNWSANKTAFDRMLVDALK